MNEPFEYGFTRVEPKTQFGDWAIREFTVTESEAQRFNLRLIFQGKQAEMITSGKYLRLEQLSTGYVVMSNTPMEKNSNHVAYRNASGSVLMAGLGMGMILEAILSKPDVKHVRIVEIDKDIIEYVGNFFKEDPRVEIVLGDIRDYHPKKSECYDYIWIDIWDDISENNVEEMCELNDRFHPHCKSMNLWSMDLIDCDMEDFYKIAQ